MPQVKAITIYLRKSPADMVPGRTEGLALPK